MRLLKFFGSQGSAKAFSPADLSSLTFWLKADSGITKDGSNNVTAWVSQDSNAYSFTPANGSPLWVSAAYNSLPTIRFGTAQTNLVSAGNVSVFGGASSFSCYIAFKPSGSPATSYSAVTSDYIGSGSTMFVMQENSGTATQYYLTSDGANVTNGTVSTSAVQNYTTINAAGIQNLYINGTDALVQSAVAVTPNNGKLGIGGQASNTSNQRYTGDICEIIMYGAAHNATNRAKVENYLKSKWGMSY